MAQLRIIKDLLRLVGDDGKILKSKNGAPLDGGGHSDTGKAFRQKEHINRYYVEKAARERNKRD